MRGVSKAALAASIVVMLSFPAQARDFENRRDRSWFEFQRERMVKIVKRVVRGFGDGITIPTP